MPAVAALRVHPASRGVRLDLPRLIAALPDMSNRQIAAVAGVAPSNVDYAERQLRESHAVDRPAETLGADGKSYPGRVIGTTTAEGPNGTTHPCRPARNVTRGDL